MKTNIFGTMFRIAGVVLIGALAFGLTTCDNNTSEGDLSSTSPFLVGSATELGYVGRGTENPDPYQGWTLDKHYKLTADIDMSEVSDFAPISPFIDEETLHFTGIFDGNGKTISNLTVDAVGDAGLFGYVGPGCVIKNIKMTDVDITSTWNAGAIGGGRGTFLNCVVVGGTVKSTGYKFDDNPDTVGTGAVGGVFGWNDKGTVQNCYASDLEVTNYSNNPPSPDNNHGLTGGVVGSSGTNSTIQNCYADSSVTVSVTGLSSVGGVVGSSWDSGGVINCVALNNSLTGNQSIGRVVGASSSGVVTLTNNYGNKSMTGKTWTSTSTGDDGADVTAANAQTENWWKTTSNLGWAWGNSESAPWKWDNSTNLPKLWFEN